MIFLCLNPNKLPWIFWFDLIFSSFVTEWSLGAEVPGFISFTSKFSVGTKNASIQTHTYFDDQGEQKHNWDMKAEKSSCKG